MLRDSQCARARPDGRTTSPVRLMAGPHDDLARRKKPVSDVFWGQVQALAVPAPRVGTASISEWSLATESRAAAHLAPDLPGPERKCSLPEEHVAATLQRTASPKWGKSFTNLNAGAEGCGGQDAPHADAPRIRTACAESPESQPSGRRRRLLRARFGGRGPFADGMRHVCERPGSGFALAVDVGISGGEREHDCEERQRQEDANEHDGYGQLDGTLAGEHASTAARDACMDVVTRCYRLFIAQVKHGARGAVVLAPASGVPLK